MLKVILKLGAEFQDNPVAKVCLDHHTLVTAFQYRIDERR